MTSRLRSKVLRPKYGNSKIVVDGIPFDSKLEAKRWQELKLLEKAGEIKDLQRQVLFVLQDGFRDRNKKAVRAISYIADFVYWEKGIQVVEDAKGFFAEHSRIKIKLFQFKYRDIDFRLVKK